MSIAAGFDRENFHLAKISRHAVPTAFFCEIKANQSEMALKLSIVSEVGLNLQLLFQYCSIGELMRTKTTNVVNFTGL